MQDRGCVFFNFGSAYALRLLVAIHSLRRHYSGPITVFAVPNQDSDALKAELRKLDVTTTWLDALTKSADRHMLFLHSPYRTTLSCDSDLIFLSPIDPLWEELEQKGVLVTRFYAAPYGIDGTPERPGGRMSMLPGIRELIGDELYAGAARRITRDESDVNIGVLGISSPKGDGFLEDLATLIERGRNQSIILLDEFAVLALLDRHEHFLAEEIWNCPADEYFRRTNLRDAKIIHYFAEGANYRGLPIGRNRNSWSGLKWFDAYESAARDLDLPKWVSRDPLFKTKRRW
jgi:hypothetical protein